MKVPVIQTPVDSPSMLEQYGQAWFRVFGAYAHRLTIFVLMSQTWIETGFKNLYNYNVGNTKAHGQFNEMDLRTREVINGESVMMTCSFAAFDSLEQGCEAQIAFLRDHYPACLDAAMSGDPVAFAHAAKVHGYMTASEQQYAAGMHSAFAHFQAMGLPPAQWELDSGAGDASMGPPL